MTKWYFFYLFVLVHHASQAQHVFSENEKIFIYEYILNETLFNEKESDEVGDFFYTSFHKDSTYIVVNENTTYSLDTEINALKRLLKLDTLIEIPSSFDIKTIEDIHSQINIKPAFFSFESASHFLRDTSCLSTVCFSNIYYLENRYFVLIQQLKKYKDCYDCLVPYCYYEFEICKSNGLINFINKFGSIYSYTNPSTNENAIFFRKIVDLKKFECR